MFWTAGVAQVEITSVITPEVHCVVAAGWRNEEAPESCREIIHFIWKGLGHGVDLLRPVSSRALVVVPNVSQVTRPRVVPHLHL